MNQKEVALPLWRQLSATASIVQAVRSGVSGTAALEAVAPQLRPGVQALVFHVWRNLGRAEALRGKLASRTPPAAADALLCSALALAWDEAQAPYDCFTLVNQSVEAAKHQPDTKAQANFLNACLRRFLRERDALVVSTDVDPVALWNHPLWWIKQIQREQPQHWQAILKAANGQAPMVLRVNQRKTNAADYCMMLEQAGIAAKLQTGGSIVLQRAVGVQQLPGFAKGWCRCKMPLPRWQPRCCWTECPGGQTSVFWTPVPRQAERPGICWSCRMDMYWPWKLMAAGPTAFAKICSAWVCTPKL